MKKVLFLLFAVLCLVSCRTASVVDSSELETYVPVVSESTSLGTNNDSAPVLEEVIVENEVASDEAQEAQLGASLEALETPETPETIEASEALESSEAFEALEEMPEVQAHEDSLEEQTGIEMPVVQSQDVVEDVVEAKEEVEAPEEPSKDVVESEEIPVQPVLEEPKESKDSDKAAVETNKTNETNEASGSYAPVVEKDSFMDRLISFALKEKLFSFGVLTIIIGLVMLLVVLVRDLVRSGKPKSSRYEDESVDEIDGGSASSKSYANQTLAENAEKKDDTTIDDEDDFLRSLLNS